MAFREHTPTYRAFKEEDLLLDLIQGCRLTAQTREMMSEALDLRLGNDFQGAADMFRRVRKHGEAFAEGYELPTIRLMPDCSLANGKAELGARPCPIEEDHCLKGEIVYCAGHTFRIESCEIKRRKDDPIRFVSGDMIIYQGVLAPEAEKWETVKAPWNNSDWLKARKFSTDRPYMGVSARWVSDENAYSHGL